jgi:ABC-type Fe3+-siderophore transport system permease subunit
MLGETVYVVTAIGAALTGAGLAVYGAAFQRKMRRL